MNLPPRTPAEDLAKLNSTEQAHTVTVVICTRNRPALLQKCLAAVCGLRPPADQVLVVDNSEGNSDTRNVTMAYGARYTLEPVRGFKPISKTRSRHVGPITIKSIG